MTSPSQLVAVVHLKFVPNSVCPSDPLEEQQWPQDWRSPGVRKVSGLQVKQDPQPMALEPSGMLSMHAVVHQEVLAIDLLVLSAVWSLPAAGELVHPVVDQRSSWDVNHFQVGQSTGLVGHSTCEKGIWKYWAPTSTVSPT